MAVEVLFIWVEKLYKPVATFVIRVAELYKPVEKLYKPTAQPLIDSTKF